MQGLLLLNKPKDITSFGAVARIRRLTGEKRIGHTGTLDPMATGVLPVLIGKATTLSSFLLDADKSYDAVFRFGISTDTCDITGNVLKTSDKIPTNEEIFKAFKKFTGEIDQTPPMFSALKKDGVPLYKLARKGESVDIPSRKITVFSLDAKSEINEKNEISVSCKVSKGTYIRSLCRDIGECLGCGATLSGLCRTSTSGFVLENCVNLEDLNENNISEYIINEEQTVLYMPQIEVTQNQAKRFCHGGELSYDRIKFNKGENGTIYRIKCNNKFLGLGVSDDQNNRIKVKSVLNDINIKGDE